MFEYNGKKFRTPLEQIFKNAQDLEDFVANSVALNQFGIEVIGVVATAYELPESADSYGQAYAVGTDTPYELYIWTRQDASGKTGHWFDIGTFPLAGPQGEQGIQGMQGPQGEQGNGIYTLKTDNINTALIMQNYKLGDSVILTNGDVYRYVSTSSGYQFQLMFNIKGEQGVQGSPGETIIPTINANGNWEINGVDTGYRAIGKNGQNGTSGSPFTIIAKLDSTDLLPDPYNTPRNDAYVVNGELYVITGDEDDETQDLVWESVGNFSGGGSSVYVNGVLQDSVEMSNYASQTEVTALTNTVSGNTASITALDAFSKPLIIYAPSAGYGMNNNDFTLRITFGSTLPYHYPNVITKDMVYLNQPIMLYADTSTKPKLFALYVGRVTSLTDTNCTISFGKYGRALVSANIGLNYVHQVQIEGTIGTTTYYINYTKISHTVSGSYTATTIFPVSNNTIYPVFGYIYTTTTDGQYNMSLIKEVIGTQVAGVVYANIVGTNGLAQIELNLTSATLTDTTYTNTSNVYT